MQFHDWMGDLLQMQPGCDGLECCLSYGQPSAFDLSPVQTQAGEFFPFSATFTFYIQVSVTP